ncbi:cyclic peptide export ABC transporter [Chitinophaga flava]|uniref:Cyclic peptide export ABC transporter n=1 Tax=Chitinophaga flava TaxID=2259036 RepID=A0A365XW14_9BACT|nr:cyclic peptide export ABC transporter [Chitinophaga flava]RBL90278.1 hypothetical protein DF182_27830 [Chitinophaga flava]
MKQILYLISPVFGRSRLIRYILLGIFAGACSFAFITAITRFIDLAINGSLTRIEPRYLLLCAAIILLLIGARRALTLGIIQSSQQLFRTLRQEILARILNSGYQQLTERRNHINTAILRDVYVLTEASMSIIQFFTALVMGVGCLIYLAVISIWLFAVTIAVVVTGVVVYSLNNQTNSQRFNQGRVLEDRFMEYFNAILNGFKEINMDPRKGNDIYEHKIGPVNNESYENNVAAHTGFLNNQMIGQVLFYLLIATVLLVFSIILHIKAGSVVSFVFTLLYLLSSIETVLGALPSLTRAKVAAIHIKDLQTKLAGESTENRLPARYILKDEFKSLEIADLCYSYHNGAFKIGPVNMEIRKGETIFIYGGNGSGKTTFIHNITGIRTPSEGQLILNGTPVTAADLPEYKTAFAVVFSDFYLFDELVGVPEVDASKWAYYLRLFELEDKIKIEGRHFSTTSLSTGQRKRLALIAALMENKPLLVLDEWAADQDPYFRKKFYTEIIPLLKKEGISTIAITHDDKYYHTADKLYKMDYGNLIREDINTYADSSFP